MLAKNSILTLLMATVFITANFVRLTESINCIQCDSSKNGSCIEKPPGAANCTNKESKCFTRLADNGTITRNCLADEECNSPGCFSCEIDGCNNNTICKVCDSSKEQNDCAQTDVKDDKYNGICKEGITKCLMKINNDKHIERGCVTDDSEDCPKDSQTCKKCDGPNCNVGIFPEGRKKCFQCSGDDAKCKGELKDGSQLCLLYVPDDKCYANADSATNITRGCVSDLNSKCAKPDDTKTCQACADNDCNKIPFEREQTLKCLKCDSKSDTKCSTGAELQPLSCANKVIFNVKDACYTQTKDNVVYRGCLYDRNETTLGKCESDTACSVCENADGCNTEANSTCIRCRSDDNPNCKNKAENLAGKCRNKLPEGQIECFTGTWNGVIIRGCLVDASERDQLICRDEKNKQCTTCKGTNCNKTSSGAATITVTTSLLALLLITVWRLN